MNRFRSLTLVGSGIVMGMALMWALSWGASLSSAQTAAGCRAFSQTGHKVCGRFLDYWQKNGGLAQQGLPLSEEFVETSDLNGKPYTVQYFERAVFELHPENQPPYDVLLSQLGTYIGKQKYTQGFPAAAGQTPFYEDRATDPANLVKSFYNAVNRKEYERAYGYFEGAPNPQPSLAPPYDQFAAGFANTASVSVAIGKVTTGAAAGSLYASMPVVITAKHTDGSTHVFSGCYTVRRANKGVSPNPEDELWRIYTASLKEAPANTPVDTLLAQNCQQ